MQVRIIYGKLKPGAWDGYERAYKDIMKKTGKFPGLRARWLTRDVADPDAGYSVSLWKDRDSMQAYESSAALKTEILPTLMPFFSGQYTTTHCEMRSFEEFS